MDWASGFLFLTAFSAVIALVSVSTRLYIYIEGGEDELGFFSSLVAASFLCFALFGFLYFIQP